MWYKHSDTSKSEFHNSIFIIWIMSSLFCSHPTSCCSVAEIMSVLFFHSMKYRPDDPKNPNNDRFILSKVRLLDAWFQEAVFFMFTILQNCDCIQRVMRPQSSTRCGWRSAIWKNLSSWACVRWTPCWRDTPHLWVCWSEISCQFWLESVRNIAAYSCRNDWSS